MTERKTIVSFPLAMLDFFGKRPDQETMSFMAELKALSSEERAEFRAMLQAIGYGLP